MRDSLHRTISKHIVYVYDLGNSSRPTLRTEIYLVLVILTDTSFISGLPLKAIGNRTLVLRDVIYWNSNYMIRLDTLNFSK